MSWNSSDEPKREESFRLRSTWTTRMQGNHVPTSMTTKSSGLSTSRQLIAQWTESVFKDRDEFLTCSKSDLKPKLRNNFWRNGLLMKHDPPLPLDTSSLCSSGEYIWIFPVLCKWLVQETALNAHNQSIEGFLSKTGIGTQSTVFETYLNLTFDTSPLKK